jgi:hypothetical protein
MSVVQLFTQPPKSQRKEFKLIKELDEYESRNKDVKVAGAGDHAQLKIQKDLAVSLIEDDGLARGLAQMFGKAVFDATRSHFKHVSVALFRADNLVYIFVGVCCLSRETLCTQHHDGAKLRVVQTSDAIGQRHVDRVGHSRLVRVQQLEKIVGRHENEPLTANVDFYSSKESRLNTNLSLNGRPSVFTQTKYWPT